MVMLNYQRVLEKVPPFPYVFFPPFDNVFNSFQFHIAEFHNGSICFHSLPPVFGRVCLEKNVAHRGGRPRCLRCHREHLPAPGVGEAGSWNLTSGKRLQKTIYDLYMVYIWFIYGLYLVYIWFT